MPLDHYITLGRSGLRVSPMCLGTMTFGEDFGWGAPPAECERIVAEYRARGGNFIDTANVYTNGHSEEILGACLQNRDRLVIATKFFCSLTPGDPNAGGAGRKAIIGQLEASLRRLKTDYIDLYWLHNWDRTVPVEETMRALDDLVHDGKVRYIGFSDMPAWATTHAQVLAMMRGWTPLIAYQAEYSLLERTAEAELVPMAEQLGMGILAWGPLKNGTLVRRIDEPGKRAALTGGPTPAQVPIIEAVAAIATELSTTPAAVALAWLRGRPGIAGPILGARTHAQLIANLVEIDLPSESRARLDAVSAPVLPFPTPYNRHLAPRLAFPGLTIDGVAIDPSPIRRN
ncbi:MAG: aldo/keto reductase [Kofleriaceae bacterium]